MARLGELVVARGLLTDEQLAEGLRAQVMFGGRLGTNLVELGHLDLDTVARALGAQHDLPAALASHFEELDAELQERLDPEIARRFECIPLRHVFGPRAEDDDRAVRVREDRADLAARGPLVGTKHGVVIAAAAPLDADARAAIADELLVEPQQLIVAVAAELRIKYFLERVYDIARAPRFLRVHGSSAPPPATPERRHYLEHTALEALANHGFARGSRQMIPLTLADGDATVLAASLAAIRASTDRERIAACLLEGIEHAVPSCAAAAVMLVRGDTAIGWQSFARDATPPAELVVPLEVPGALAQAAISRSTVRVAAAAVQGADRMLLDALHVAAGELVVVPIVIDGHATSLVACALAAGAHAAPVEACAAAAAETLGRLVRAFGQRSTVADQLHG